MALNEIGGRRRVSATLTALAQQAVVEDPAPSALLPVV
jgi:hypothetical protein